MPVRTITAALAALLMSGLALLAAPLASAQEQLCYPPPCTSSISDDTPEPGEEMTVSSGPGSFTPGETIEYGVESTYQRLGETKADAAGAAIATFAVPTNLELGGHHVVFTSVLTGNQVRVRFTLVGAPAALQSNGLGLGAVTALALGAALLAAFATGGVLLRRQRHQIAALTARLRPAPLHDPLTGLPTSVLLHDRIEHALAQRIRRADTGVAVLRLGLDAGATAVAGQSSDDRVLVEVARRLEGAVRHGDTLARLSGGEFALVLADVDIDVALAVADRVTASLAVPVELGTSQVTTAASIGIALSDGSQDGTTLLDQAEIALREAELHAPGSHRLFGGAREGASPAPEDRSGSAAPAETPSGAAEATHWP